MGDSTARYGPHVQFRVLGPLEVDAGEGPIPLGGPKQRAVLASLLVRANEVVPADTLIDEVWGDEPPDKARNTLQTYVSNLRRALGNGRLRGRPPGYVLVVDPPELDAARFAALLREAKRALPTDPAGAVATLDAALELWRGPALAGLTDHTSLVAEATRLEELRVEAEADRIEGLLGTDAAARAVGDLEALVTMHPLRERLWALLMLALYREGRQAEALGAFQRARELLADELGIDPSTELVRLQRRILDHDPTLELRGEPLRGYRLLERIGQGSLGVVHRAIQPHVGREVAIKTISPAIANDPAFVRRFEAEAQAVARLEHPHVVPLYDSWRDPDGAYLVMRYLSGGSLRRRLDVDGPMTPADAARLVSQLARALAAAHRQGIVHRGVKPENVLLDDEGNAYLGDFAIATDPDEGRAARAESPGSVAYLAPEQIRGERATAQTDVYALGVLAYEVLIGSHPFDGGSVASLPERILREPLPSVRTARAELPTGVDDVIARATAKEPALRFPDTMRLAEVLERAIGAPAPGPVPVDTPNPYKGLRAFSGADAGDFFGREALVERLLARLSEPGDAARFLGVVGPSGSGKSSAVRAGLVPALGAGALEGSADWFAVEMAPGPHPLEELAAALRRVAVTDAPDLDRRVAAGDLPGAVDAVLPSGAPRLVLVVDQLEEAFTLVPDEREGERRAFLDALATVVDAPRLCVVATLRADFYDRPLTYPRFGELLAARTEAVPVLDPDELELAIRAPAEQAGVRPGPGLVAEIVADVAHQPGALPLVQFALTELFEHRDGDRMTLAAYRELGGIAGALSARADRLHGEAGDAGRRAIRHAFLRLVTLGEGRPDTRRLVTRSELDALDLDPSVLDEVLEGYGRHRLLTFDREPATREPTVEIAHEALIGAWHRLRGWIDAAREDLRQERALAAAAADWRAADRDPSFLLRGARLERSETWAAATDVAIARPARTFLEASVEHRDAELDVERTRLERERALERRAVRRLRGLVAVFAVAALVAAALTVVATDQTRRAEEASAIAAAREVAAAAVASIEDDPERAVLLAIEAVERTRTPGGSALPEAVDALHRAIAASRIALSLGDLHGPVAWSGEGVFAAAAAEASGTVEVRDGGTGAPIRTIPTGDEPLTDLAFSPDGRVLAATSGGHLRIWDTGSWRPVVDVSGAGSARGISFGGGGGSALVAATWPEERVVRVFETMTGRAIASVDAPAGDSALSPDGTALAVETEGRVRVLGLATATPRYADLSSRGDPDSGFGISSVAWSPDGRTIATVGIAGLDLWDAASGALRATQPLGWGSMLAWAGDSSLLLTGGRRLLAWPVDPAGNLGQATTLVAGADGGDVTGVSVSPDAERVVSSSSLGPVSVWDSGPQGDAEWMHADVIERFGSAEFLENGAVVAADERGRITTWDPRAAVAIRSYGPPVLEYLFDVSPEGLVAIPAGTTDELWDADTGTRIGTVPAIPESWSPDGTRFVEGDTIRDASGEPVLTLEGAAERPVLARIWSGDGRWILMALEDPPSGVGVWDAATGAFVRTIDTGTGRFGPYLSAFGERFAIGSDGEQPAIWDISTGRQVTPLRAQRTGCATAFSPDGRLIASGGDDLAVRIYDAATGEQRLVLRGHDRTVCGLAFSRDGSMLVSQSPGELRVWALDLDDLLEIARANVTRSLTDEECRRYLHLTACP